VIGGTQQQSRSHGVHLGALPPTSPKFCFTQKNLFQINSKKNCPLNCISLTQTLIPGYGPALLQLSLLACFERFQHVSNAFGMLLACFERFRYVSNGSACGQKLATNVLKLNNWIMFTEIFSFVLQEVNINRIILG